MNRRSTFAGFRMRLLLLLLPGLFLFPVARAQETKTVALVTTMPVSSGWGPVTNEEGLVLAAGTILEETLARVPHVTLLPWRETSGFSGLVGSGLYRFQAQKRYDGWLELLTADVFVEMEVRDGAFRYQVHCAAGSQSGAVENALKQPKAAIAAVGFKVFDALGVEPGKDLSDELRDPETKDPALFLAWAHWIGYIPSIYNEIPWQTPNVDAAAIIHNDPEFMRGMAWALQMLLKPVPVPGRPGQRRTANPALFDLNVLRVLQSRFADRIVDRYNARLREDPMLRQDSLGMLHVEGRTVDLQDVKGEGEGGAAGTDVLQVFKRTKTTPGIRKYVCLALSGIEDKEVVSRLAGVLVDDPDASVREAAATSLGGFKAAPAIVTTLEDAFRDESATVRLAVLRSLARLGEFRSRVFQAALKDASPEARWFAMSTLIDRAPDADGARRLLLEVLARREGPDAAGAEMRAFALGRADSLFPKPDELRPAIAAGLASDHAPEQLGALRLIAHYSLKDMTGAVKGQIRAKSADVRARAVEVFVGFDPANVDQAVELAADDASPEVQRAVIAAISGQSAARHLRVINKLLKSRDDVVRVRACNAVYKISGDDRVATVRAMLSDPSMRVNFSALRLIEKLKNKELTAELAWVVTQHPNEYVRCRALELLDRSDDARCHELALESLRSPYFIVRLFAADILERRGRKDDGAAVEAALRQAQNKWLELALADTLARCAGGAEPQRVRLGLGKREHTEGGELANGWQLWLGELPTDPKEARRLVDEGYRFGAVLPIPTDTAMYGMSSWDNSKGMRNTYLLHVLDSLQEIERKAPYLYYLCEFDEPHGLGGGDRADMLRAFLLEMGRPDLLDAVGAGGGPELDAELQSYWWHYGQVGIAEVSNWVVKILRMTMQRKYPDMRLFPQTLSYMGAGVVDAWPLLDADGDYTWRYDNENIFGHYGIGAMIRAMRPGQPSAMVTWLGWCSPHTNTGDVVFTDTQYPPGPWRLRAYMGTRAALALYASGIEPSFFNYIGYKSMSTRGEDTGGAHSFPFAPWSPALTGQINKMIAGDKAFYWDKVRAQIEAEVMKKYNPDDGTIGAALKEDKEAEDLLDIDDTKEKMKREIKERYEEAVRKQFLNTMIGCSWMNIFDADNTRAMSNLPKPDTSPRGTLLVLGRGAPFNGDGETFVMPAVALADGFDMVPNYQCAELVDFLRYDTIMVLDSPYGVSSALVRKVNQWLQSRSGMLYVCGDLNTRTPLLPKMTFDSLNEKFLWEDDVAAAAVPRVEETYKDKSGKEAKREAYPRLGAFDGGGGGRDDFTRLRFSYGRKVQPLVQPLGRDGGFALALWRDPAKAKAVVLFDGAAEAGPIYTGVLEKVVLDLDAKRNAQIKRNRYWGHIGWEDERFVVDVATSGYSALQAARPRQHRGVDIISGDINPLVEHDSSALILKNYVGPYAGGMGDWAVMAREELKEMALLNAGTLRVRARGVTRVSHVGNQPIVLKEAADFEKVEGQLDVWKAMWEGKKAFSTNDVPGGRELHFFSPDLVTITAGE